MLAVQPERCRFSTKDRKSAAGDFLAHLREMDRDRRIQDVTSTRNLLLDQHGRVGTVLKMTTTALKQLCSRLAPGLSQAVCDVAGEDQDEESVVPVDPEMAIKWVNDAIRLRFEDRMEGCRLIISARRKQLDGIVGPKYKFLSNLELFDRAQEFVRDQVEVPAAFNNALVMGRRIMLRYRHADPLFEVPTNRKTMEPFFGGFHFSNSEVGDCSVRAAITIIRQWCDNTALGTFEEGGRLVHAGNNFFSRFENLLDRVQRKAAETGRLKENVLKLMDTKLGFGDPDTHNDRVGQVVNQLHMRGLTKHFAKRTVNRALYEGSYEADRIHRVSDNESLAKRTAYDLFNALTNEAKSAPLDLAERSEQLGYEMLVGAVSIN